MISILNSQLKDALNETLSVKDLTGLHQRLTQQPEFLHSVFDSGNTLCHYVLFAGWPEAIEVIADHSGALDLSNSHGDAPIHIAALSRSLRAVAILTQRGVPATRLTSVRNCILHLGSLASVGHYQIYRYNEWAIDPIESVAFLKGAYGLSECNLESSNIRGETPLFYALKSCADSGFIPVLQELLELGGNPNHKNNSGDTPLHEWAAFPGPEEIPELLKNFGANPHVRNSQLKTPAEVYVDRLSGRKPSQRILRLLS